MKKAGVLIVLLFLLGCGKGSSGSGEKVQEEETPIKFTITDFYSQDTLLQSKTEAIYEEMDSVERIGQMIVAAAGRLGKPTEVVEKLIAGKMVGGVLLLNGSKSGFKDFVHHFDSLAKASGLVPLVYSADAEPSLINRKIEDTQTVPKTVELTTTHLCDSITQIINKELLEIGIKHNYAPVVDISPDNEAIKNRSFGYEPDSVVKLANVFVKTTQKAGIAATVKHFPGHGLVKGDTHSKLVFIDGELKEAPLYKEFIDQEVLSVMVGHIAVRNNETYNTNGLPSSCSRNIVTDLLRDKMDFKGIIITDAMNMGALKEIDNACLKAVEAGCDIILMPDDEEKLIKDILDKIQTDDVFRQQVETSIKRVIRLKLCLGVIE